MGTAVLEAKNIKKRFGGVIALNNGYVKCEKGRITGLLGMNGSGKSTISKIISGIYRQDKGEIIYNGKTVSFRNPNEAKKNGISMVFQNLSLVPDLNVWQNIVLNSEKKNGIFLDNKSARDIAKKLIDQLLPGMDMERNVNELSPGEMQVVEIAKAIAEDPKVLILDEPTASLEREQVQSLFKYMRKLAKNGVAMVFTSHRMWEVLEICDDVIVFRNGDNVGSIDFRKDKKDLDAIVNIITGESGVAHPDKKYRTIKNDYILEAENLQFRNIIKGISIKLKKGEILGIGGLTGQGQHELLLALAGSYKKTTGKIKIAGDSIKLNKPKRSIRNKIMLVPGDRQLEGLFMKHTLYKNLIFPKLGLKRHPLFIPGKRYREDCKATIKKLSIVTKNLDMPVETLSGGNQQKVVVGKWLTFDTKVLLLSDPAKGVDVGAKRDMYRFICELALKKNVGVILYASDSEELLEYCDRVLIMYEGKIVKELIGKKINEDAIVAASMNIHG